jgi:coenzyme F420-reducing hydrogenase delta subunit/DNA-binding transcriptional ArsR family regulator
MACIGGLDPVVVFETFTKGADGVLLIGCSLEDCHFIEGSIYAEFTVNVLKKLLVLAGLEPKRLELHLVPPVKGVEFINIIEDFATQLETLGPSPLRGEKPDVNILENVWAARNAVADFRLRAFIGKEMELIRRANVYGEKFSREEFSALLDEVVKAEFIRQKILLLTKKNPLSVKQLARVLDMKPSVVLRHILNMRRMGVMTLDATEGTTPLYKALETK